MEKVDSFVVSLPTSLRQLAEVHALTVGVSVPELLTIALAEKISRLEHQSGMTDRASEYGDVDA